MKSAQSFFLIVLEAIYISCAHLRFKFVCDTSIEMKYFMSIRLAFSFSLSFSPVFLLLVKIRHGKKRASHMNKKKKKQQKTNTSTQHRSGIYLSFEISCYRFVYFTCEWWCVCVCVCCNRFHYVAFFPGSIFFFSRLKIDKDTHKTSFNRFIVCTQKK